MVTSELEPLWGRGLRMWLTGALMEHGEATVAELVDLLDHEGHTVGGRPSKVVSDALRWEIANGRVARISRGRYRYLRAPATTERRIVTFVARCRAWLTATAQGEQPPLTLQDPREPFTDLDRLWIHDPPWTRLGWLWGR
ncbi:MAG: hypothetical protein AAF467_15275 [Actinomycetota bacterium]